MGAQTPFSGSVGTDLFIKEDANATPEQIGSDGNIFVHQIQLDATKNPKEDVYIRFWDAVAAGAPTNGTTGAWAWFWCPRGKVQEYHFTSPQKFLTGCFYAVNQEAGGSSGNTAPSGQVDIKIVTSTS